MFNEMGCQIHKLKKSDLLKVSHHLWITLKSLGDFDGNISRKSTKLIARKKTKNFKSQNNLNKKLIWSTYGKTIQVEIQ